MQSVILGGHAVGEEEQDYSTRQAEVPSYLLPC